MRRSFDLTTGFLASRHPAIATLPKRRWRAWHLRRLIWCGIAGVVVWTMIIFAVCALLWLNALTHEHARLAEVERAQQLEREAEAMRLEILRIADLHSVTASQSMELASHIQGILDTLPQQRRSFIAQLVPEALRIQAAYHIPASATLGMAAYESAFGESDLARQHHNYFGLKAFARDWPGPRVQMPTRDNGVRTKAWFRTYTGLREGVQNYAEFLLTRPRYQAAFTVQTGPGFVAEVAQGGYCPDHDYAKRVAEIISRHGFERLDTFGANAASTHALTASRQTPAEASTPLQGDSPTMARPAIRR